MGHKDLSAVPLVRNAALVSARSFPADTVLAAALMCAVWAASSGEAQALNECGDPSPGATIICGGSSYPNGIEYGIDGRINILLPDPGDPTLSPEPAAIDGLRLILDNPDMVVNSDVSDDAYAAIQLYSSFFSTQDLFLDIVNAKTITSSDEYASGVFVGAEGNGNVSVRLKNGDITAAGRYGIWATNDPSEFGASSSTGDINILIEGGSVSAPNGIGAFANQSGSGATTITMTGGQVSAFYGLWTEIGANSGKDATVAISGGSVASNGDYSFGAQAATYGTGSAVVNVTGGSVSASGDNSDGLSAYAPGSRVQVNVDNATVSGGSGFGAAIHTTAGVNDKSATGNQINIGPNAIINGSRSGVAINNDYFAVVINTAGTVIGDINLGGNGDTVNLKGGSLTGDIDGGYGDDIFNWTAGTWTGNFYGVNGANTATISASGYDGSQVLDGGAGSNDKLNLNGLNVVVPGANIINWENITLKQTKLAFSDNTVTTGSGNGMGMFLTDGSMLDGRKGLALTGDLSVDSTSTFSGSGSGAGVYSISGNVNNAGTISTQDGATGDQVNVAGNYISNGGTLKFDTVLGADGSPSDQLITHGTELGSGGPTRVSINNIGGSGAKSTGDGIKLIDVQGGPSDPGAFVLSGPTVVGIFRYALYQNGITNPADGDWYLRSTGYSASVYNYQAYPQVLLDLLAVPMLDQRIGDYRRHAAEIMSGGPYASPIWTRIIANHNHVANADQSDNAMYDSDTTTVQSGIDMRLSDTNAGLLIAGIVGEFSSVTADTISDFGTGTIITNSLAIGPTLTWYGRSGFFIDDQAKFSHFSSDMSSFDAGKLVNENIGSGYALSLEAGQKLVLNNESSLTLQAQLAYSEVDFNSFIDQPGAVVSLTRGKRLNGRLGLILSHDVGPDNSHAYAIANVTYEFLGDSSINASGTGFDFTPQRLGGELGVGGTRNWAGGKYALFGEATVASSFAGSYETKATLGLRARL